MTAEKQRALDALWAKMIEQGDFPSLSHSIQNIVSTVQTQGEHLDKLVSAVVADFTLTQRVLRLANSAMYAPFGGNVMTVSRAVLVLGQDTVGHLALGLRLLDSFKGMSTDRTKAKRVLAEATLAGHVARRLTKHVGVRESEEAVVCSLLSRLGELACIFYAPQAWAQVEDQVHAGEHADTAAQAAIGVTLTEIGQDIARRWGLPERLRDVLSPFELVEVQEPLTHHGWLRAMSAYSGRLARDIIANDPHDIAAATEAFAPLLALDPEAARVTLDDLATEAATEGGLDGLADLYNDTAAETAGKPADAEQRLHSGLSEIIRSARECQASVLLHMALEVIHNSLGCARSIAFVLDAAAGCYRARAGIGAMPRDHWGTLAFEAGFAPDIFHLTLSSRKPVHIGNPDDSKMLPRIPAWHRERFGDARSLMLLPLAVRNRPVALLYTDWTTGLATTLTGGESAVLRDILSAVERGLLPALGGAAA